MGKDFKRHYIFGGNTDRGVPNTATSVFAEYVVKLSAALLSYFHRVCLAKTLQNRPMVTESDRLYHFDLGLGQSWNHPLY